MSIDARAFDPSRLIAGGKTPPQRLGAASVCRQSSLIGAEFGVWLASGRTDRSHPPAERARLKHRHTLDSRSVSSARDSARTHIHARARARRIALGWGPPLLVIARRAPEHSCRELLPGEQPEGHSWSAP